MQPPAPDEPGREQGDQTDRHHDQQVAARQFQLEQVGSDRDGAEDREGGLDDPLVFGGAVADGLRIPTAGPGQRQHPDNEQDGGQRDVGHVDLVDRRRRR